MAERPRDFKKVGQFEADICGPLDGGMVILQLCRWKFSHKETL